MNFFQNYEKFFFKKTEETGLHRLIFFPYAGGAGEVYIPWFKYLSDRVTCFYAQLPGRGKRFYEKAFDQIDLLVDSILPEIIDFFDVPVSFYGHSMGALIAFELAHRLRSHYNITPQNLFLSGHRPPSLLHNREILHKLSPKELICYLRDLGGISRCQSVSLDMIRPFLPTLYSDFKLCETYRYIPRDPLTSQLIILWGNNDFFIQKEYISLWKKEAYNVKFFSYEGDHFFINRHYKKIANLIKKEIFRGL